VNTSSDFSGSIALLHDNFTKVENPRWKMADGERGDAFNYHFLVERMLGGYGRLNIRNRLLPKSLTNSCFPMMDIPNGKSRVCALDEAFPAFLELCVKSA